MGKRKLQNMDKIKNETTRKITYCKRKKGLLKKAIELSKLCDQICFLYIYDRKTKQAVHYASDQGVDLIEIFNQKLHREFFSNDDYGLVGGEDYDLNEIEQEFNLTDEKPFRVLKPY